MKRVALTVAFAAASAAAILAVGAPTAPVPLSAIFSMAAAGGPLLYAMVCGVLS